MTTDHTPRRQRAPVLTGAGIDLRLGEEPEPHVTKSMVAVAVASVLAMVGAIVIGGQSL